SAGVTSSRGVQGQSTELLRLWLGPFGAPIAVLKVTPDGSMTDESVFAAGTDPPAEAVLQRPIRVSRQADRWTAWIPIPKGAIGSDGVLRFALERLDERGIRSSWPRAMLPWQREPGRAAVGTGAWGDV